MNATNPQTTSRRLPPGQKPIKRLLQWGIDHPGITPGNPKIDLETYTLEICGEVEKPMKLNWAKILDLPVVESTSDFHCVEGWSVLNCRWEGPRFSQLVKVVKPKRNAVFVTFECADGYTTSLSIEELLRNNALLAYRLNGNSLEEGTGFPIRLVVPDKYGYKSALWVIRILFTTEKRLGYWERRGYSDTADVWKNDRFSR